MAGSSSFPVPLRDAYPAGEKLRMKMAVIPGFVI
jgi:hypothetical protein